MDPLVLGRFAMVVARQDEQVVQDERSERARCRQSRVVDSLSGTREFVSRARRESPESLNLGWDGEN